MAPKAAGIYGANKIGFTEARVDGARKAVLEGTVDTDSSGRRSWLDADCPGLMLRVNAGSGSATYYFQAKVGGQSVRRALGDIDAVRLVEAREAVRRLRYDRSMAGVLAPRPAEADAEPTDQTPLVGAVMDDMLAAHAAGRWLPGSRSKPPSDRTSRFYGDLRRAVRFDKVRRKVKGEDKFVIVNGEDFEGLTLAAFADRLGDIYGKLQARAPIQANRGLQLWRNLYSFAEANGLWTKANPAIGTGKNRLSKTPEKTRTRWLTDAEWKRLDTAMKKDSPLWRDLFSMSAMSLQRMSACCNAKWSDITLTGTDACWRIPARWMKGRKTGHIVPLADLPELLALLRARRKAVPKGCPWVFPAPEGDGPVTTYKTAWKRVLEAAGLWSEDRDERPRPHDLRRTGGARMTEAGVPLQTVTRALGNAASSASMVAKVYSQVSDAALKEAFAAVSRRGSRRR